MDAGTIYSGGIDHRRERRIAIPRPPSAPAPAAPADSATISTAGQKWAASADRYVARLSDHGKVRAGHIESALQRLQSGALDDPEVFETVARKLLAGD